MHYFANVIYLAGDKDYNGLRKGESRQIRNGRTGLPCWKLEQLGPELPEYVDSEERPDAPTVWYAPLCHVGEGKARAFDAARDAAVWPDATDEELSVEPEELKRKLAARIPKLMQEFKHDIEELGFVY